jgi:hypothetical protein
MARLNPADRMTVLLRKQEQIANQLKQLKSREKDTERKADTRRKVIAGALALEHMERHPGSEFSKVLISLLNEFVEERSRHLFAFLPKRDGTPAGGSASDSAPAPPGALSMAAAARATTAPG